MTRLPPQPGERISRARTITFSFDGKDVEAYEGDTIGSALYAAGRRTFSRSFKYHRRRGLLCCAGQCANCLVAVDGAPGVRACTEPARDGMNVEHMNARPSLELDVMSAVDVLGGPFTPPGFYYKTFIRPRRFWPLYEKLLRHAAGLGVLAKRQDDREWRTEYRRRHCDVLVVGGGAAGLRAAIAAAGAGADVVLCDEGAEPGGRLLAEGGYEDARAMAEQARAAGVEVLSHAPALGWFDGLVPVWQGDTLHQVRARSHVFATGTIEQPLVFAGNDLPGIMLSGGARRLASLYGVKPGTRVVVATTSDAGIATAEALCALGIHVVAVADARLHSARGPSGCLTRTGTEVLHGYTVVEAKGRRAVKRAVLGPVDGVVGGERSFACDLLVISAGAAPAISLPAQAGAKPHYDVGSGVFRIGDLPEGVHAAGEVAGAGGADAVELSGRIAGLEAAIGAGFDDAAAYASLDQAQRELGGLALAKTAPAVPPVAAGEGRGKCFACFCEDVTAKDLKLTVEEGYDSIELAKRYSTVTMGPCQGRMCQLASVRLVARETGESPEQIGLTTARPPWSAVPVGALAGRPFEPAKRSAIHGRHRELGASVQWAGDWRRAYDYGDPHAEALAVQRSAGLIDVSTLGKLLVRGPDAGAFLDRLYPNRMSSLKPGRIRYGVLTSDAGRILDDGTVCRVDEDTFYVTTTSSGAGAVEEWFGWWLADWGMDVRMTDVTQALAAMNIAGPNAREILGRLTDIDVSNEGFAYLDGKQAPIAGVPCLALRIGFVGEVGYELHCPAPHAERLWDAMLEAGADLGVRPFGLEPQRLLRLQKMHILVGQDTDSESTPFGAAMPWIVKLDKDGDFVGRWALEHYAEQDAAAVLIGFTMANGHVPLEGAAVVYEGVPAGQVTSCRWSPLLEKVIGLAWVPAGLSGDGAQIAISDRGQTYEATVQTTPFYDPDGAVLRS